jgi:hypothetical protein
MRRRRALPALPALLALAGPWAAGCSALRPARAAAGRAPAGATDDAASDFDPAGRGPANPVPPVLAWGPDGAWIVGAGVVQALPAGPPPVAVVDALWTAGEDGQVRRWQAPATGGDVPAHWRVTATHATGAAVHALAASADGQHALAAHGERLTLLDAQARPLKQYEGRDLARTRRGAAGALFAHAGRRSFVVAWPALGELWEIPLDPDAAPIHDGLVHDYRMGEALPSPGHLGVRRVPLGRPLPRFEAVDGRAPWLAGRVDEGVAIVHLDVRRRIATLALAAARPAAAALVAAPAGWRWWLPAGDGVQVVDAARWTVVDRLPAPPGLLALRASGPSVWAYGDAGLQRWQDGAWRPLAVAARPVTAFEPGRGPGAGLLATSAPAALLHLDADGRVRARRALPAGARIVGLAALAVPLAR